MTSTFMLCAGSQRTTVKCNVFFFAEVVYFLQRSGIRFGSKTNDITKKTRKDTVFRSNTNDRNSQTKQFSPCRGRRRTDLCRRCVHRCVHACSRCRRCGRCCRCAGGAFGAFGAALVLRWCCVGAALVLRWCGRCVWFLSHICKSFFITNPSKSNPSKFWIFSQTPLPQP